MGSRHIRQIIDTSIVFIDGTVIRQECMLFRHSSEYNDNGLRKFIYYHVLSSLTPEQIHNFKSIECDINGVHYSIK